MLYNNIVMVIETYCIKEDVKTQVIVSYGRQKSPYIHLGYTGEICRNKLGDLGITIKLAYTESCKICLTYN